MYEGSLVSSTPSPSNIIPEFVSFEDFSDPLTPMSPKAKVKVHSHNINKKYAKRAIPHKMPYTSSFLLCQRRQLQYLFITLWHKTVLVASFMPSIFNTQSEKWQKDYLQKGIWREKYNSSSVMYKWFFPYIINVQINSYKVRCISFRPVAKFHLQESVSSVQRQFIISLSVVSNTSSIHGNNAPENHLSANLCIL